MATIPASPQLGDPVVVEGTKYRIKRIEYGVPATAHLKESFGGQQTEVRLVDLIWDPRAGLWRLGVL